MTEEHPKYTCPDCDITEEDVWFEKAPDSTSENIKLIQHGIGWSNCLICDEMICENCYSEHAQMEAFG